MSHTGDYRDGRAHGTEVFARDPQEADSIVDFLRKLETLTPHEPRSLYFVAFETSVNQAIANSLS